MTGISSSHISHIAFCPECTRGVNKEPIQKKYRIPDLNIIILLFIFKDQQLLPEYKYDYTRP